MILFEDVPVPECFWLVGNSRIVHFARYNERVSCPASHKEKREMGNIDSVFGLIVIVASYHLGGFGRLPAGRRLLRR